MVGWVFAHCDFVYPYVEVAGRAWEGRLEKQFSYREE